MKCIQRVSVYAGEVEDCHAATLGGDLCPEHLEQKILWLEKQVPEFRAALELGEVMLAELRLRTRRAPAVMPTSIGINDSNGVEIRIGSRVRISHVHPTTRTTSIEAGVVEYRAHLAAFVVKMDTGDHPLHQQATIRYEVLD